MVHTKEQEMYNSFFFLLNNDDISFQNDKDLYFNFYMFAHL